VAHLASVERIRDGLRCLAILFFEYGIVSIKMYELSMWAMISMTMNSRANIEWIEESLNGQVEYWAAKK
jgi:hypothetical protein